MGLMAHGLMLEEPLGQVAELYWCMQHRAHKSADLDPFACTWATLSTLDVIYDYESPPKIDVWSFGVILFTILVGRLPFVAEDDGRKLSSLPRIVRSGLGPR